MACGPQVQRRQDDPARPALRILQVCATTKNSTPVHAERGSARLPAPCRALATSDVTCSVLLQMNSLASPLCSLSLSFSLSLSLSLSAPAVSCPAGPHFACTHRHDSPCTTPLLACLCSATNPESRQTAPRTGFFLFFDKREVCSLVCACNGHLVPPSRLLPSCLACVCALADNSVVISVSNASKNSMVLRYRMCAYAIAASLAWRVHPGR